MLNKGVIKHMKENGVKYIYLGPVDNILLKLADPTCLGYMVKNNFDIVSLYVDKISAEEKVGLHLLYNGKARICEYTETTKQVKEMKDGKEDFVYKHGSRATMFITRDFIESITTNKEVVERINKRYLFLINNLVTILLKRRLNISTRRRTSRLSLRLITESNLNFSILTCLKKLVSSGFLRLSGRTSLLR